ncbi:uncharacterized protein [Dysidea avara]|uniref:uncharacterized protein isoform X1 n=2 Tax=Dysidea avara TaxID=196820 RepID=UPI0033286458
MYAVSTSMASTKLVCKKRKISGYNIYHREILKSSDPSVCLGDLNKMIGEQWQALAQQEREEFNQIASVEPTRVATLKDFLNHLAKLVLLEALPCVCTEKMHTTRECGERLMQQEEN